MKKTTALHLETVKAAREIERKVFQSAVYFYHVMKQRHGEALMNGLKEAEPDLYDILAGTPEDPRFDDAKYERALAILGFGTYRAVLDRQRD